MLVSHENVTMAMASLSLFSGRIRSFSDTRPSGGAVLSPIVNTISLPSHSFRANPQDKEAAA